MGVARPAVVGDGQRHLVLAVGGIHVVDHDARARRTVAEAPLPDDRLPARSVLVGGGATVERGRQAAGGVGEVGDRIEIGELDHLDDIGRHAGLATVVGDREHHGLRADGVIGVGDGRSATGVGVPEVPDPVDDRSVEVDRLGAVEEDRHTQLDRRSEQRHHSTRGGCPGDPGRRRQVGVGDLHGDRGHRRRTQVVDDGQRRLVGTGSGVGVRNDVTGAGGPVTEVPVPAHDRAVGVERR